MRYFLILILFVSQPLFATCQRVSWDESATLKNIIDGDTVTLDNGRLVRFIGINTPEINHKNLNKSEAYALNAKALLEKYIHPGDKIHLVYDQTKLDKYGRKLAYVYSKTGRNLALLQLQSGFAKHWVIGKNDKFWTCFQAAEQQARLRKRGVWSDFKPLIAARLSEADRGYAYVKGRITELTKNKKGLQMVLDKHLTIFIAQAQLKKFTQNHIDFSEQQKILINGKVNFSGGKFNVTLYHPAQILP